jgi:predicted nucleic acid-binding protein
VSPEDVPDGPLCVDSDVFSWVYGQQQRYREFNALIRGHLLVVSFATVGELRAGAMRAQWDESRRQRLEQILRESYIVLTATDAVVTKYAELHVRFRGRLRDRLKNGNENDLWTAACALAQPEPVPIITNNLNDFQTIANEFPLTIVHPDL